jgi:2TM domain-containing protein
MQDQQMYNSAKRKVRQIRGFYIHATIYVLVNVLLMAVNLGTSRGKIWFFWPLLGWGIGLAAHGLSVFEFGGGLWGPKWQSRKIQETLDKRRSH